MLFMPRTRSNLLATGAIAVCLLFAPARQAESTTAKKYARQVEVEFRGCNSAGWCRFLIDPPGSLTEPLIRVRTEGVPRTSGVDATSIAVRNRLNALLSNMIHQAKHIVLRDLRKLDDGTFAAIVTVNGIDLASDPVLMELREKAAVTNR
jgi:hypothetical protein